MSTLVPVIKTDGGVDWRIAKMVRLSPEELLSACNFGPPNEELGEPRFGVIDAEGGHDPCYLVLPNCASMVPFNHWGDDLTDVARVVFVARACNEALAALHKPVCDACGTRSCGGHHEPDAPIGANPSEIEELRELVRGLSELLACSVTGGAHFAVEPELSSVDATFEKRSQAHAASSILCALHPLDEEGCFLHRQPISEERVAQLIELADSFREQRELTRIAQPENRGGGE